MTREGRGRGATGGSGAATEPGAWLRDPLAPSPLAMLACWIAEARAHPDIRNADAVALATVDAEGEPDVRMVLARGLDPLRGWITFYTDRGSVKGRALDATGRASLVFHWDALARQVRLGGRVIRAPDADSDAYFASRPRDSRIAAWTSEQSRPVASREALERTFEETARRWGGVDGDEAIPRPEDWGGYVVQAERIELWVERAGRLHDRARWTRSPEAAREGDDRWRVTRLQP